MAAVAALLVVYVTQPPGPGLDPDSASYLGAAESVAHGRGYRIPIADWLTADSTSILLHFPPGLPTAIAVPAALGMAPPYAARVVNAASAFILIAIIVWLVAHVAGIACGVALGAAVIVTPALVEQHFSVLSEPLYLACTVCALAAMVRMAVASDERHAIRWTLAAGLAGAVAVLVRYAGASVGAAVVVWAALRPGSSSMRLRRTVCAALPSIVLFGGWVTYVRLTSAGRTIRTLGAYPGILATLREGWSTVVSWIIPLMSDQTLPGRAWLAVLLLLVIALVVIRGIAEATRGSSGTSADVDPSTIPLLAAALLLAATYLVVLLGSRLLADPAIPFDNRLLAPLFLLVSIAIAVSTRLAWRKGSTVFRVVCAAVVLAWLIDSSIVTQDEVQYTLDTGHDFAESQWIASPLLAWARANALHRTLYSNWPQAIYFHLHRAAHELPNAATSSVLEAFTDTLRVRNGIVLAFDHESPGQIGPDSLLRAPRLRRIAQVADGSIFVAAP